MGWLEVKQAAVDEARSQLSQADILEQKAEQSKEQEPEQAEQLKAEAQQERQQGEDLQREAETTPENDMLDYAQGGGLFDRMTSDDVKAMDNIMPLSGRTEPEPEPER